MKLIIIFGPSAVGKMTVGKELEKITDFKLFHNHMFIEPLYLFFGYGDEALFRLTAEYRNSLFKEIGKSHLPGIIFTYVWALDEADDHQEILNYMESMQVNLKDVLFVELQADQDIRIERNKSDLRLKEKKSKNNIEESENFIYQSEMRFQLNSNHDFFYPENHVKVDNTALEPHKVALIIKDEMIKRSLLDDDL